MNTELKVAKANWKAALKNIELYKKRRDELLMRIVDSEVPKWGNIKIIVTKL
jgi:hypothetical protein